MMRLTHKQENSVENVCNNTGKFTARQNPQSRENHVVVAFIFSHIRLDQWFSTGGSLHASRVGHSLEF